jgi:hypothetical protein
MPLYHNQIVKDHAATRAALPMLDRGWSQTSRVSTAKLLTPSRGQEPPKTPLQRPALFTEREMAFVLNSPRTVKPLRTADTSKPFAASPETARTNQNIKAAVTSGQSPSQQMRQQQFGRSDGDVLRSQILQPVTPPVVLTTGPMPAGTWHLGKGLADPRSAGALSITYATFGNRFNRGQNFSASQTFRKYLATGPGPASVIVANPVKAARLQAQPSTHRCQRIITARLDAPRRPAYDQRRALPVRLRIRGPGNCHATKCAAAP